MKLVTEYLADAAWFDHFAALEKDAEIRERLQGQAEAYRKLAEQGAKRVGAPRSS